MKRTIFYLVIALLGIQHSIAQNEFDPFSIDVETQFPGGIQNLGYLIQENMKYPEMALIKKGYGKVFIDAKIDTLGNMIEVKILQGVSKEIDDEALRIISILPQWEPAMSKGIKVTVPIRLVITFPEDKKAFNSKEIKAKRKQYKKEKRKS